MPRRGDFPTWEKRTSQPDRNNVVQSIYQRYKEATNRFQQSLQRLVPAGIFENIKKKTGVNALIDAVDYLKEQQEQGNPVELDPQMLEDLKVALRVRKRVAASISGGGDEGHAYFISLLNYCWSVLRPMRTVLPRRYQRTQNQKDESGEGLNRFEALSVQDDEDGDNEDDLPSGPVSRPVEQERLSLDELINGSDRFQARLLILSMNEMMGFSVDHYKNIKKRWRSFKTAGDLPSSIIEDLMEAAVSANFNIQQVISLEQQLAADYPHLDTFYRVMVLMVYPGMVKELADHVVEHYPRSAQFREKDAIEFLGDCFECAFRNKSDPLNRPEKLASEFADKWHMPRDLVNEYIQKTELLGKTEAPLNPEFAMNHRYFESASSSGVIPHCWLQGNTFIGGDRSMVMTVRLLQGLSNLIQKEKGPLEVKRGSFGRQWDEGRNRASKIQGDLDEFLMGDALPVLLYMCSDGMLSMELPRENELLTFFTVIKSFVANPEKAIPWSLAFAVHTLLTSVIEMQGDTDMHDLATTAKASWDQYFDQLKELIGKVDVGSKYWKTKHWKTNLDRSYALRWLVVPTGLVAKSQELRAVWNPLCGGIFLVYLAYFGNLDCGTAMVDSSAQLRIVLHLYNALLQVKAFVPGDIELLDYLNKHFSSSKAIWEGPKPEKGQLVKRWWIAYGMKPEVAQRLSEATRSRLGTGSFDRIATDDILRTRTVDSTRQMTGITPEDLSTSYRRICLHDFSDVEDRYHSDGQRHEGKHPTLYDHAVRVNDSLDAMYAEQRLLATNLTSLGDFLDQFFFSLFNVMEWNEDVDNIVRHTPTRSSR